MISIIKYRYVCTESMDDGPEATANPTEKCNNNHRGMSPSREDSHVMSAEERGLVAKID